MKRILCCVLLAAMLFGLAAPALADGGIPAPIETIPFDELPPVIDGQHHYLLLVCSGESWIYHPEAYTDGIMLVTLDTRAHRVMLTSFIRDAIVQKPDGKTFGRINGIVRRYSPEVMCQLLSEHIGVRIEKYLLFDLKQIANIIDYLGGVEIEVNSSEASYLRRYPLSPTQTKPSMNRAGTYLFNGRAAVIYMRIRKAGGGGDFMRTQRARTVLSTLADKCREITYDQARALVDSIMENTSKTNMNLDEMISAMDQAYQLRGCTIEELRIPQDGDYHPFTLAGMATQELDWPACREAMNEYLQNSWLVMDDEE